MDTLRSMGVKGADGATGAQEGEGQGAHLPNDVGRLKALAAQKEYFLKNEEDLEEVIKKKKQAELAWAHRAAERIKSEHETLQPVLPRMGRASAPAYP